MIDSWKIIKNEYLDYLRQYEQRIPLTDYGTRKMKPFFGALFEIDNLIYVTQVSSPKPRHMHMKNSLDFQRSFDFKTLERYAKLWNNGDTLTSYLT